MVDLIVDLHKALFYSTLHNIKKIALMLMVCLFATAPAFAQNNVEGMRFLTVNALMQYGQRLYDRGDYNEATAVFNHVLTFDGHQAQALQYLKEMGHSTQDVPTLNPIDTMDTKSLQEAIEAKKRMIAALQTQIRQMRANIASQSAEE